MSSAFNYITRMVIIGFPDSVAEQRALGMLVGRFSFKTWSNGDLMVSEQALPFLTGNGIPFFAKEPALAKTSVFHTELARIGRAWAICMSIGVFGGFLVGLCLMFLDIMYWRPDLPLIHGYFGPIPSDTFQYPLNGLAIGTISGFFAALGFAAWRFLRYL